MEKDGTIQKYLFKYKSISGLEDVERFRDIIKNDRIYYPMSIGIQ